MVALNSGEAVAKGAEVAFDRCMGIGGSDVAAIVGLSTHRSAFSVWAEKVGHPSAVRAQGVHLRFGSFLEPFVASEYERRTQSQTHVYDKVLRHPTHPQLFGHVDRLVTVGGAPCLDSSGGIAASILLECKTANAFSRREWGSEWTDQVPSAYFVQCMWYLSLTGCEEAHVAVLIGNSELRIYCIKRDVEIEQLLTEAALKFWSEHVLTGIPPKVKTREDALCLFDSATTGKELKANDHLLSRLRQLCKIQCGVAALTREAERIKDEITCSMGEAESITYSGKTLATWKNVRPADRIDVARMRRERPDLVAQYSLKSAPSRRFVLEGV